MPDETPPPKDEALEKAIHAYLKENLQICIWLFPYNHVSVELTLAGERISEDSIDLDD